MARPVNRYGLFSYSFIGQQAKDRTQALQWLIRHHDQPNHHQYLIIEEFSKEGFLKSVFNGNCRASIPRGCVWWNVDRGLRLEKGICHVNTNWSLIVYHWSKNLTLRQAITFWSIYSPKYGVLSKCSEYVSEYSNPNAEIRILNLPQCVSLGSKICFRIRFMWISRICSAHC